MKNLKPTILAVSLALASTAYSVAQDGGGEDGKKRDPLVTVTQSIDPNFKSPLKSAEFRSLRSGLAGLGHLTPITVSEDDLYSAEDLPANKAATQLVSDIFVQAAKDLVVIKVLAYRYAAGQHLDASRAFGESLKTSYRQQSEGLYQNIIRSFISGHEAEFTTAMGLCQTEHCAARIGFAQTELERFGWAINQGLSVGAGKSAFLPKLDSDIVNYATQETFRQITARATESKVEGEALVTSAYEALITDDRRTVDFSAVVDSGIERKGIELYFLKAVEMKAKDKKKLNRDHVAATTAVIRQKVEALAKPQFGSEPAPKNASKFKPSSYVNAAGQINRRILDVDSHGSNYLEFLFKEALGGIGRCMTKNFESEARLGLRPYRYELWVMNSKHEWKEVASADNAGKLGQVLYSQLESGFCGPLSP